METSDGGNGNNPSFTILGPRIQENIPNTKRAASQAVGHYDLLGVGAEALAES
jgi:hypothetical protein